MEDYESAIEIIRTEVKDELSEVRKEFLDNFGEEKSDLLNSWLMRFCDGLN